MMAHSDPYRRKRGSHRSRSLLRRVGPPVLVLGIAAALAATTISAQAASQGACPAPVCITVGGHKDGYVGTGFAGFSYEKDRIGAGVFDPADTNLVNLFRLLGPSVLRVGGNLNDRVHWNHAGAGGSTSQVAPPDVTKLAAFLRATGWKAIYGINLKTNTPENAASEAQFAAHALGASLLAFEIGNEPNFYKTETQYETSFNTYVAAIRKVVPGALFAGPGAADHHTGWVAPFAAHEKNNALFIVSAHTYIGDKSTASVSGMFASNPSAFADLESALDAAHTANGIAQWRMTEANSYFHGGAAGVSDVKAAALWSLDLMHGIAVHHGKGVNFHGGTSTQFPLSYSPIVFSGITPTGVQGVYYGELLWVMAGTGALHWGTVVGASGVTAWGIGNNVIINNKSDAAITVSLTLVGPASGAREYLLTGHALDSRQNVTIAKSGVGVDGSFTPRPEPLTVAGHRTRLEIPRHSAALVVTH